MKPALLGIVLIIGGLIIAAVRSSHETPATAAPSMPGAQPVSTKPTTAPDSTDAIGLEAVSFNKHGFVSSVDDPRLCHVCGQSIYNEIHPWTDPKNIVCDNPACACKTCGSKCGFDCRCGASEGTPTDHFVEATKMVAPVRPAAHTRYLATIRVRTGLLRYELRQVWITSQPEPATWGGRTCAGGNGRGTR